jgi:hypothetical protein
MQKLSDARPGSCGRSTLGEASSDLGSRCRRFQRGRADPGIGSHGSNRRTPDLCIGDGSSHRRADLGSGMASRNSARAAEAEGIPAHSGGAADAAYVGDIVAGDVIPAGAAE